ncbi:MAG: RNA methyltransferase [Pseudomonadota bacterium]
MTTTGPQLISSRDNAWLKDLRRLAQDHGAWRKQGQIWLEGDHLCRAALARGVKPSAAVFTETAWTAADPSFAVASGRNVVLPDALFAGISGLESPASVGFVIPLAPEPASQPLAPTVVLDRVQDAGNVGAILRCASAFGFTQVIALKGTASLWSPKVVRAGMGAHFALSLIDAAERSILERLAVPLITTSSHQGELLHEQQLPWPCAWAFGHEGQGVGDEVASAASIAVRIIQPGGEESLNVATAAAICLHASAATARQRL